MDTFRQPMMADEPLPEVLNLQIVARVFRDAHISF